MSGASLGNWKQVIWPGCGVESRQCLARIILDDLKLPDKNEKLICTIS